MLLEKSGMCHCNIEKRDIGSNTDENLTAIIEDINNAKETDSLENSKQLTGLEINEKLSKDKSILPDSNEPCYETDGVLTLPPLVEFTTIVQAERETSIKQVGLNDYYWCDQKNFKIRFEQFIDKFLKNSNEVLKRHSITIRKKGATAVYRCQHYRKFVSCKFYIYFSFSNKNDSILIKNYNKCIHVNS